MSTTSLSGSTDPTISAAYAANQARDQAAADAADAAESALLAEEQAEEDQEASWAAAAAATSVFGAFGPNISFEVSDPFNITGAKKMFVPSQVQRETRGRWTSYNLIGRKPLKSFEGPESATVTLTIALSADNGINPRDMLETIRAAIENGSVDYLVIGGKTVGGSMFYIESMSETWERFFQGGRLIKATGEITFVEYN